MKWNYIRYLILIFAIITSLDSYSQNFGLTVNITNIKSIKGEIKLALYTEKESFLDKEKVFRRITFKITQVSEKYIITNLPKGVYAIALFQDANSDGKCNTNFLGAPKEGYGFSNNYKPFLSAPSFSDCKFNIQDVKAITIALIN